MPPPERRERNDVEQIADWERQRDALNGTAMPPGEVEREQRSCLLGVALGTGVLMIALIGAIWLICSGILWLWDWIG